MADILYLALAIAFFAASIGLVHVFDRLWDHKEPK